MPEDWRKQLKALQLRWRQSLAHKSAPSGGDGAGGKEESEEGRKKRERLNEEVELAKKALASLRGDLPDETSVLNGHFLLGKLKDGLVAASGDAKADKKSGGGGFLASLGVGSAYSGFLGELDLILRAYDKADLHLVENAQYLVKATDYEIPALSAKLSRVYTQISDSDKREEEYVHIRLFLLHANPPPHPPLF